jgi:hypothetical protein
MHKTRANASRGVASGLGELQIGYSDWARKMSCSIGESRPAATCQNGRCYPASAAPLLFHKQTGAHPRFLKWPPMFRRPETERSASPTVIMKARTDVAALGQ